MVGTAFQFDIRIKTAELLLSDFVLRHTENVRHTLCAEQVSGFIRHHKVLWLDKLAHGLAGCGVKVNLLERATSQRQIEQKHIQLRIVFLHHVHDVVIHEVLNALRLRFNLCVACAHDLRLDRPLGW